MTKSRASKSYNRTIHSITRKNFTLTNFRTSTIIWSTMCTQTSCPVLKVILASSPSPSPRTTPKTLSASEDCWRIALPPLASTRPAPRLGTFPRPWPRPRRRSLPGPSSVPREATRLPCSDPRRPPRPRRHRADSAFRRILVAGAIWEPATIFLDWPCPARPAWAFRRPHFHTEILLLPPKNNTHFFLIVIIE